MLLYCIAIQFNINTNESGLGALLDGLHKYIKESAYLFSLCTKMNKKQ